MARRSVFLVTAMVVLAALVAGVDAPLPAGAQTGTKAGYIVVFRDSVNSDQTADDLEQQQGFRSEFRYRHALKGLAAQLTPAQAARLAGDPDVAFLTPDHIVEAVGTVPIGTGDVAPTGVRRIEAATTTTARQASTVNVAVIDTGVDLTHPDLNATSGVNCVSSGSSAQDDNGHGTHVAGTIAAMNNGSGVVGVVPGTKVYAVKVLNSSGSGTWSQVICGIDWVTANAAALNIKVANMSLGGSGANDNNCGNSNADALHKAICNSAAAGVTYAVAAGNSAVDFAGSSPANYPEVLAVTAISDSDGQPGGLGGSPTCRTGEADDAYATFSNFAVATTEINHTIAAPGVCTYSTWLSGGYNTISGTSMATPHIAGSVALCLGEVGVAGPCAGLTPAAVIQKLRTDAADHTTATPGYGFAGDPNQPRVGAYFGYLVWDGAIAGPDFSLSAPSSISFVANTTKTFDVTVTPSGGFSGTVTLTPSSSPTTGLAMTPASATLAPPYAPVTFTAASSSPGSYTVTVTGVSGSLLTRSTTMSVTVTSPPTVAGAPVLSATAGNASVSLSWRAPSDGGSAITNYKLYRGTASGGETLFVTLANVASYTDTGLTNGTTYYYKVTAVNGVGESAASNEAPATPQASTAPSAPQNLAASSANKKGVQLSWQAPIASGSGAVTNYRIYRSTSSGTETFLTQVGNSTGFKDISTVRGTTYFYKVTAVNVVGESPPSNEASARAT